MQYAQFCPIAKATEILGDKWSLLIIRELLMGGNRFNVLQRGLGSISPTILTKRLNELCDHRLVVKHRIAGQKGYEYYLTESGKELLPVIEQLGSWGMRWARKGMPEEDLDPALLMLYLERSIIPDKLIGTQSVIRFQFTDLNEYQYWWLVVQDGQVDTCIKDPGKEVDIYFTTDLRTMIEVWVGDVSYRKAVADDRLKVVGPKALSRDISTWIRPSLFDGIEPATEIVMA